MHINPIFSWVTYVYGVAVQDKLAVLVRSYIYILLYIDGKRKRSSNMIHEKMYPAPEVVTVQLDDGITPKPFDVDEYLSHFKRHHKTRSSRQATIIAPPSKAKNRYALFILDGSGSITNTYFQKMKFFVGQLAFIFQSCGFTGVMTYNDCTYLQFNFTCYKYKATYATHNAMLQKILDIPYPNGLTGTGDAIERAFEDVLKFIAEDAAEIDVIIITDGHSNTGRDPCLVANEIWNKIEIRSKVNVFPIGIGNINYSELHCLMGEDPKINNPLHVLNFTTLEKIGDQVFNEVINNKETFCARFDNFQEVICEFSEDFIGRP